MHRIHFSGNYLNKIEENKYRLMKTNNKQFYRMSDFMYCIQLSIIYVTKMYTNRSIWNGMKRNVAMKLKRQPFLTQGNRRSDFIYATRRFIAFRRVLSNGHDLSKWNSYSDSPHWINARLAISHFAVTAAVAAVTTRWKTNKFTVER